MKRTVWVVAAIGSFIAGWLSNGYGQNSRFDHVVRNDSANREDPGRSKNKTEGPLARTAPEQTQRVGHHTANQQ